MKWKTDQLRQMRIDEECAQVHHFMITYQRENLITPSLREIKTAVGLLSTSTTRARVQKLVKQGKVQALAEYCSSRRYRAVELSDVS